MCGFIGIVTDPTPGASGDPGALVARLQKLPVDDPAALTALAADLDEPIDQLFSLGSVHALLWDEGMEAQSRELGQALGVLAEGCERRQETTLSVGERELYASLSLRLHDLAWRLLQDLLPNLDRIRALCGQPRPSLARAREAWKLNTLLNGLDRLEVRGRDSAGLSVQVAFPTEQALARFEEHLEQQGLAPAYERARNLPNFVDGAVARAGGVLTFVWKVAREIGELGENVAALRASIQQSAVFWAACEEQGVLVTPLAHTRWASNGIISEPNCHPLNNDVSGEGPGPLHTTTAVLNGDIDNFQRLKERLRVETGRSIAPEITTDAKTIPLWIDRYLDDGLPFEEAFRRAVADFAGSMAIAVQTSREPGRLYLALKGSGQSVYVGRTQGGYLVASELYGLVEETSRFWKMDGEKVRPGGDPTGVGQVFVLDPATSDDPCQLRATWMDGAKLPLPESGRRAEITTRDINRRGYRHFLLKEISEAVRSVRKTLEGKYITEGGVGFPFLGEICPPSLLTRLEQGQIRHILCIGQGTASIAGEAIADVMRRLLQSLPVQVTALKATELSGGRLRDFMADTLVIAVSQSGTTTDTNRTVDLVRQRGAAVLAVVNRRNSDLVYKADAVLYTSDGRDIEMSVASTKAFYAQVTAGYLLALALAQRLGAQPPEVIGSELKGLAELPDLIGQVVAAPEAIRALAERYAVRHRYWALVGSGPLYVAAQEIRIKLSELCYKAIPVDYTEDKKHIDLSSEPLVLICAAGLPPSLASDVAKEVAIFKAHKAIPVVIATEGEHIFDPYAAGVLTVPRSAPGVAFVLATVAGHLWGYFSAQALDGQAQLLRKLRARMVEVFEQLRGRAEGLEALVATLRTATAEEAQVLERWLVDGSLDSGLNASTAVKLSLLVRVLRGRMTLDDLYLDLGAGATRDVEALEERCALILTAAVEELTRPIDAIRHQAKTVTVGISRAAEPRGALFEALGRLGVASDQLLPTHAEALQTLTALVGEVKGAVLYRLDHLDATGAPGARAHIEVVTKLGIASHMRSRLEGGGALTGTKRQIVAGRRLFAGVGSSDGQSVVMFPLFSGATPTGLALLHVQFDAAASVEAKRSALRHYHGRYDEIVAHLTEQNVAWNDNLLAAIPPELLFEGALTQIEERVLPRAERAPQAMTPEPTVWS